MRQGLLRFNQMFGSASNQVPPTAGIDEATLTLWITNRGNKFNLHHMQRDWEESDTWNRLGNGLSPGEFAPGACAMSPVDAGSGRVEEGRLVIDVTACVEALQADPDPQGWALLSTGGDSVRFASSEASNQTQQPLLKVDYLP